MSRWRFGLLAGAVGLVVAGGSFTATVAVLDDGKPDPPPTTSEAPTTTAAPAASSTTERSSTTVPGTLVTPAWIVVVASEGSQDAALERAESVAAAGYPAGVLHSDDFASLNPGLWVAYTGPYPDRRAAESAVEQLARDGVNGAYVRCAGSVAECRGDDGDGNGNGNGGNGHDGDD